METIYHKLIQAEQELSRCDMTLSMIGRQLLSHINKLNSNTWYTEFAPQDFFNAAGDKQAQAYLKTSNMIFLLATLYPDMVSQIKWPKVVCVLSDDGFVVPTNKPFPEVTVEAILQKTSSFLSAPTKAEQEALAAQVNASL